MKERKDQHTAHSQDKTWQTTQYSNLIHYVPSGVYYARIKRNGKEIRQSLKTQDRALAKRRLGEKQREVESLDLAAGKITVEELLRRFVATFH